MDQYSYRNFHGGRSIKWDYYPSLFSQWLFNLRFLSFHRGIYCLLCTSAAVHLTFIALLPTELFLKPKKGICVRLENLPGNCLKHWNKSYENHTELARKYFPISQKSHFFNFDLYSPRVTLKWCWKLSPVLIKKHSRKQETDPQPSVAYGVGTPLAPWWSVSQWRS